MNILLIALVPRGRAMSPALSALISAAGNTECYSRIAAYERWRRMAMIEQNGEKTQTVSNELLWGKHNNGETVRGTVIAMLKYFQGYNEEDGIDSFGIKGSQECTCVKTIKKIIIRKCINSIL